MKKTISLILITVILISQVNGQDNLTAEAIMNKSIDFCGGMKNISKIKSSSLLYTIIVGDSSRVSLVVKRIVSQKFMNSLLSDKHMPNSTHFNGVTLTTINGDLKLVEDNLDAMEEVKLQTYNLQQVGYKELSYSLKRLDDMDFGHFKCYVVSATGKNGYMTLNYFDKTDFRLIMVIYPKGNKSLMMEYTFKDSVLFNTKIVNVEENDDKITWLLNDIENNKTINPLWFDVGNATSTFLPRDIKSGTFISSSGAIVDRMEYSQTER